MSHIKLVLSDMDGTLLSFGQQAVSMRTMDAIEALRRTGIAFGPSSGRELCDLIRFFHGRAHCVETGIMGNGKLVYLDGELVYRRPLPRGDIEALAEAVKRLPATMLSFYLPLDERGQGETGFACTAISQQERERYFADDLRHELMSALPEGEITTCAVVFRPDFISRDEIFDTISAACPRLDFPQPAPDVFDVVEKGWSKVSALPFLLEHLGIDATQVAYLGDSQNDLTMMAALPHSYCMGNGSEEAKAAARWVVDSCENDGAAQVMEMLAACNGFVGD